MCEGAYTTQLKRAVVIDIGGELSRRYLHQGTARDRDGRASRQIVSLLRHNKVELGLEAGLLHLDGTTAHMGVTVTTTTFTPWRQKK